MNKLLSNKNIFKNNKKIIFNYLNYYWKLILFFFIFYLIINISLLSIIVFSNQKHGFTIFIGSWSWEHGQVGTDTWTSGGYYSVYQILNYILLSTPSIIFFSIIILVFINKIFVNEINNGKINLWLSLPLSKEQILMSKFLFIILSIFIIFLPSLFLITIFSAISYDANQYFGYVMLYELEFILFLIFLIFFYFFIFIIIKKSMVANIIAYLFIFWILVFWIISLIYKIDILPHKEQQIFYYLKFFSPLTLITSPLQFLHAPDGAAAPITINENLNIYPSEWNFSKINKIIIPTSVILMSTSIFLIPYLNIKLFKKIYIEFNN